MPDEPWDLGAGAKVALLIDAENVTKADYMPAIMKEAKSFGRPTIKRAYGNWTGTQLGPWKKVLHEHAVQPIQQFSYTEGKNGTDAALIIDAMDLLYAGQTDVFCIVASDSDYTRLATRIREAGKSVIGIGASSAPDPLKWAFDRYISLETILGAASGKPSQSDATSRPGAAAANPPEQAREVLREAIQAVEGPDGWANAANFGVALYRQRPDFDSRTYGSRTPVLLAERLKAAFEVRRPGENAPGTVLIRRIKQGSHG
ncbi:MAG: NYN domain-containing protein [Thermoplasmatota archaeon]